MPEALELPSLTAAAARAASNDDIPGAAALLRQAVELQTSTLGPEHPDLATTLNNLALMLERLGHVKEAGKCYRRAHAIAAAALGPDDPVVQVSRANLDAFRATYAQPDDGDDSAPVDPSVWGELRDFPIAVDSTAPRANVVPGPGIVRPPVPVTEKLSGSGLATPLELTAEPGPTPRLKTAPRPEPEPEPELALQFARTPVRVPTPHPAGRYASPATRKTRSPGPGILVAIVILAVAAAWWWGRSESPAVSGVAEQAAPAPADAPLASVPPSPEVAPPAASATPPPASAAAPAPASPAPGAAAPSARTATPPAAATPVAASNTAPPAAAASRPVANGPLGVADARLCATLSRARNPWACQAAGDPVRSGSVYYYTRVRSTRDATIRHRWSRDGRVVQDVRLRIRANPTDGFRTFSRQTVSGLGAGAWVVTLLGPDGTTLDEQRFSVR